MALENRSLFIRWLLILKIISSYLGQTQDSRELIQWFFPDWNGKLDDSIPRIRLEELNGPSKYLCKNLGIWKSQADIGIFDLL